MEDDHPQNNRSRRSPLGTLVAFFIVGVLPLALGIFLASRLIPEPKIGVIRLNYDIFSFTTYEIGEQLAYAREDPSIKAVVLIINSPGGSAANSEELYLTLLETRESLPVVASIDQLAASGAYYLATAADEIYAKPTSSLGSIGVIGILPSPAFIEEEVLTTGPYKAFGSTRDSVVRQLEMAKFTFLEAIAAGRGDRLTSDLETLSRAEIYSGIQAKEMGLIDGLLSTEGAVERAAEIAGLRNFQLVELYPLTFPEYADVSISSYRPEAIDSHALWAPPDDLPAGLYYRYIEPLPVE